MNRQTFLSDELTEHDRSIFIAKLITAIKQDDWAFRVATKIIEQGEENGLFDRVKFTNAEGLPND